MARVTDARGPARRLAPAALACAWLGCTAPNPAYDPAVGGEVDHEGGAPELVDAARGRDRSPVDTRSVTAEADASEADASAPLDAAAVDTGAAAPARDVAADNQQPDVGPDSGGAAVESTGLVAYWALDEGAGNSLVQDQSGNGNRGGLTVLDPAKAWVTGHAGAALEIPDQVGVGVLIPASPSLDRLRSAFTLSAWVYREATSTNRNYTVLSRRYGNTSRELYSLSFQSDTLTIWLYVAAPGNEIGLHATRTVPLKTWVHVAATWDGKTVRLYQDGAQVATLAYATPPPVETNPLMLGNNANTSGVDQPLGGRLDEVRVYDRALAASAIAALAK